MRRNKLRELLEAGKPTIGTHLLSTWPATIEAVGHTGMFDYVEFMGTYAPYDLYDLDNMCRAAELYDMSTMIKVDQEPRRFIAQRAIGAGFQSCLFADVRNVADVVECVKAVRPETPEGKGLHGVGLRRASYMLEAGRPGYVKALSDVVIALMIEKGSAVEHLEEILSVPGVDMTQFGGGDYCMSMGCPGEWNRPDNKAVEQKVIETSLRLKVVPRAEISTVDEAKYYLDLGVRHFNIGEDLFILFEWLKKNGEELRKIVSQA
jgi:2-keto-3-deoxy-L-rhamnonate aldolase RhmA